MGFERLGELKEDGLTEGQIAEAAAAGITLEEVAAAWEELQPQRIT